MSVWEQLRMGLIPLECYETKVYMFKCIHIIVERSPDFFQHHFILCLSLILLSEYSLRMECGNERSVYIHSKPCWMDNR